MNKKGQLDLSFNELMELILVFAILIIFIVIVVALIAMFNKPTESEMVAKSNFRELEAQIKFMSKNNVESSVFIGDFSNHKIVVCPGSDPVKDSSIALCLYDSKNISILKFSDKYSIIYDLYEVQSSVSFSGQSNPQPAILNKEIFMIVKDSETKKYGITRIPADVKSDYCTYTDSDGFQPFSEKMQIRNPTDYDWFNQGTCINAETLKLDDGTLIPLTPISGASNKFNNNALGKLGLQKVICPKEYCAKNQLTGNALPGQTSYNISAFCTDSSKIYLEPCEYECSQTDVYSMDGISLPQCTKPISLETK